MDYFSKPTTTPESVPATPRRWSPPLGKTIVRQNVRVKEERVSIMYSVLPASIQNRLPPLPSIRRTVMPMMGDGGGGGSGGGSGGGFFSPPSSGAATPVSDAETAVMDVARMPPADETDIAEAFALSQIKPEYAAALDGIPSTPSKTSGVDWRCGRQGAELIVNAVQESKGHVRTDYNAQFERAAYVDGVAYLLKGLPRNLDKTEATVLRRSLPASLGGTALGAYGREDEEFFGEGEAEEEEVQGAGSARRAGRRGRLGGAGSLGAAGGGKSVSWDGGRNLVHRWVLFMLVYVLAWIRWVAPYVFLFFSELVRYEREYKVSENVFGTTMAGLSVGLGVVRRMGDGVAGQVLADAFDYTADGVAGALKDFASEVGGRNQRTRELRVA